MLRSRILVALLALGLAVPTVAFAQGAGDDQYQDPFPEESSQGGGNANAQDDDGLSDEPSVPGGEDEPVTPTPTDDTPPPDLADEPTTELPNTGSDPWILAYIGLLFVLAGVGLRLRTMDPDSY